MCFIKNSIDLDLKVLIAVSVRNIYLLQFVDLIRNINDPEHPLTLEELNVVEQTLIEVTLIH